MAAAEKSGKKAEGSIVMALALVTVIGAALGGGVGYILLPVGDGANADKPASTATAANDASGKGANGQEENHGGEHGAKDSGGHGHADVKHGADAHETPAKEAPVATAVKELPPIVTNLADSDSKWIRLQAAIVYDPAQTPHVDKLVAELASDITTFLRSLRVASLEGADGLRRLQEELSERAEIRSEHKVRELIIEAMVVQ